MQKSALYRCTFADGSRARRDLDCPVDMAIPCIDPFHSQPTQSMFWVGVALQVTRADVNAVLECLRAQHTIDDFSSRA